MQDKKGLKTLGLFIQASIFLFLMGCPISAQSQEILYFSNNNGTYDIWAMKMDGSNKINLSIRSHDPNGQFNEYCPHWSPDGQKIAFFSNKSGVDNIWIMDADGRNDYNLTHSSLAEYEATWSPDGTKIYFARNQYYSSGGGCAPCPYWEIYVRDLAAGVETRLTYDYSRELSAFVSPDGNFITYTKAERASDCCNPTNLWIMNADGSNSFQADPADGSNDGVYEWPTDWGKNNKILFRKDQDIFCLDPVNLNLTRLTTSSWYVYPGSFSPDGKKIVYTSNQAGSMDVWVMNVDGTGAIQLTDDPGEEWGFSWRVPPAVTLNSLGPATLWAGLKNSDDQGTQFDLKIEVYREGSIIAYGVTQCITGLTRNPDLAREVSIPLALCSPQELTPGETLAFRVLTRIGTLPDGSKCPGPGGSHSNATGLRVYYDASTRPSRFGAEVFPKPLLDQFLHTSGTYDFFDPSAPLVGTPKYKDSSGLNFRNGNPWKEIGTWTMVVTER